MLKYINKFDIIIIRYVNKTRNKVLDRIMPLITACGNLGILWIVLSFFLIRKEVTRKLGIMIISALILTMIIGEGIIKHIVKRKRPFINHKEEKLLISTPITYSFPSGHTASSFAVAGVFIETDSNICFLIITLATLITFSRLYLKVHYPSDVVCGGFIGFICAIIIVYLFHGTLS